MADPGLWFILPGAPLPEGGVEEVGNKAWNLMLLAQAGLPVPPGFVLPTSWCRAPRDPAAVRQALAAGIAKLESATGLGFGAARRPLLVSVRSGAAVSMPGMLETVLDIGLNAASVEGLLRLGGNPRLAWDCDRRLVQGYAEVVAGLPPESFDALLGKFIAAEGVETERDLDHRALRRLAAAMREHYAALAGAPFPADPMEQLAAAVESVFGSWNAPKAIAWRRLNKLDDAGGTAVTVQTMVFGNAGGTSGAGVGFTRDPATGAPSLYFDFCLNGQGEDVVAGRRTTTDNDRLRDLMPDTFHALQDAATRLEALFRDSQDFEFTVHDRQLHLLQTRRAQRTPIAALRMAVDMVAEGLIRPDEALWRLDGVDLASLGQTRFAAPVPEPLARAVVAGVGVASGPVALDMAAVERFASRGNAAILVRPETVTADTMALAKAAGLLSATGSRTAHAAVVARQLGKVCLVGCPGLDIDADRRTCRIGGICLAEGDPISLDGNTGAVYAGALPVLIERPDRELAAVAAWRHLAAQPAAAQ
ncbi:MAG TPA: PEP/pyruvate-binding domain-containing protein [Acetobacteraceae bacterium]|nr:PEP/pyruvate-binding domain-containing protein [Acetobacteraceae bacterium]